LFNVFSGIKRDLCISSILKELNMNKIRMFFIICFFCNFSSSGITAEADSPWVINDAGVLITKHEDYNSSNTSEKTFTPHKPNYILIYAYSDNDEGRKNYETKFQISAKVRVLRVYDWAWYFAYSQKSFWQIYDEENSRPFREINFNPETFIRSGMWSGFRFDLGYEHESNGQSVETSRSWDRAYLFPYFENDYMAAGIKGWYRIKEKEKKTPEDVKGDQNPDIQKYYGYGELYLTMKIRSFNLGSQFRYNYAYKKGSMKFDATFPVISKSIYWYIQYWQGYGESLVDYNINQKNIGFGFMFTR
jgi:phospholipase A1